MTDVSVLPEVDPETTEYQSLSPLAALAFVLGLLSLAALSAPLLLVVPVAAIGAAWLALVKIRASGGVLSGARLAQWGLSLGLACAVTTVVRDPVRNALMRRQTQAVAEQWLSLVVEGKLSESLKFLDAQAVQSLGPRPPSEGQKPPAAEEVLAATLEKMRSDKLTLQLAKLKPPLRIVGDEDSQAAPVFDGARTLLSSTQLVTGSHEGDTLHIGFSFVRSPYYEAEGRPWRIERWAIINEPAPGSSNVASPGPG
jgi:hypothetical protein